MMGKFIIFITIIIVIIFILKIPALAQIPSCEGGTQPRAEGLITTPQLSGKFATSGKCVVDPKSAFVPFKIPSYDDLKSLYFDQSKSARKTTIAPPAGTTTNQGNLTSAVSATDTDRLIFVDGDLQINGNVFASSNIPIVVFVKNNLQISANITYGKDSSSAGLMLVVGGNIVIDTNVSEINAILAAQGFIYTAGDGCKPNDVETNPLIINGSLISLNPDKTIKFCRRLEDNIDPAEEINHQVKYLVILRNLLSDTYQKWSEIP